MKVEHNIARLKQLLEMYRLSVPEFLELVSGGLKNKLTAGDVFAKEIKLSHLKRIDRLFDKGLYYYLDAQTPEPAPESSVFFRKQRFATDDLNIGAVKTVNRFEELKHSLSAMAKLSGFDFSRKLPSRSIGDSPKAAALEARAALYPKFKKDKRAFLKALIGAFAERNILVFEFVETWNKKDKANIDGFFLKPNMIVLKRNKSFRREIFTLAHELGHYLLEEEEIESLDYGLIGSGALSKVERWCNDFAYFFLAGPYADKLSALPEASPETDYHTALVNEISNKTHLSKTAIYTRMRYEGLISPAGYGKVKKAMDAFYRKREEEKELEKALLKERGIKQRGAVAKPIVSPLFVQSLQNAFYEGVINEYEFCKKLNIKPEQLDKYIQ